MGSKSELAIDKLFSDLQINELMPDFDVYLPNSRFRKSSPGDPNFLLYLCRGIHTGRHAASLRGSVCSGWGVLIGSGDVRERCRMGSVTHNQYLALAKLIMILMWEHVIVDHSKNMKALA
ncbi:unnamed protein product [Sphenostylis stenocarpa]|uniref:Uncharacterized protein n=1 Tax=Sphenostylis stenocarpa TaxID=92480 RepID=A0AA86VID2_9FABA|nr:unnamed protein product [Sphenostylis stenocarpa]